MESILNSKFLNPDYLFNQGLDFILDTVFFFLGPEGQSLLLFIFAFINVIFFVFAVFFIFLICYSVIMLFELRAREHVHLKEEITEYAHHKAEKEKKLAEQNISQSKNLKWNKIIQDLLSANMSDWKLAVIEADSLLENLMDQLNFKGENLGERLKNANPEKFRNLSSAWEVHTIRNKIAHQLDFDLSPREAKRIINLYEIIFREFDYI
mgnify:FL=1